MAILDIDTDQLRSAVAAAETANKEITEAMKMLNRIVVHKDWECPQRNTINSYTVQNKETAKQIQENASSFYQAIKKASDMFDETEQNNLRRTNQVDGLISEIASVVTRAAGGNASPSITSFDSIRDSMEG